MTTKIISQSDYEAALEALEPGFILVKKHSDYYATVTCICPECGIGISQAWDKPMVDRLAELELEENQAQD